MRGSLALRMLHVRERRSRVVLGLQRGESGTRIFLRLQMQFRADDGGLRRIVFRRTAAIRTGSSGSHDGLASVAHLLHGRTARATGEAGDTTQDNNEPEHRVPRH